MMNVVTHNSDPYTIDPLVYLESLAEKISASDSLNHYRVLIPSLSRLQAEEPPAFDLAVREVVKKLGIKAKTVKDDLRCLAQPPAAKDALKLLERMGAARFLRLAQDFQGGELWYGVVAGEDKLLVNSDRELLTLDNAPEGLTVKDGGFDLCRFSKDGIVRFLGGAEEPGSELLAELRTFFLRFAVFRDKRIALLLAVWALGTYCYRVFRVFPYLALRSPDKRCGKSRVLDLLSLVAFNASAKTVNPTEAQLFRGPSRNGGTLLLDEVEKLGQADKENYAGLLSVLNSGFEANGTVQRQVKDANGNFVGVNFETFAPYAIAGINRTTDTLEDRSIVVLMQRKLSREKVERFSPSRLEDEVQALRDRCYIWALTHASDLSAVYDQADKYFSALDALDDRARDLWEPLVSITAVADAERGDGQQTLTEELTALACVLSQVRDGTTEDSIAMLVVKALQTILALKRHEGLVESTEAVTLAPTDLASLLKGQLGWEKLSPRTLATLVNPLGFYSKHTRDGERGRRYHLTEEALAELSARYGERLEEEEKLANES
jgi:Protein of unknown function (DUF3631)